MATTSALAHTTCVPTHYVRTKIYRSQQGEISDSPITPFERVGEVSKFSFFGEFLSKTNRQTNRETERKTDRQTDIQKSQPIEAKYSYKINKMIHGLFHMK